VFAEKIRSNDRAQIDEVDYQLSAREREVLELLARGYLTKQISDRLGIRFDTVRTYIRRIYEKMQVHSRSQAVAKYLQPSLFEMRVSQLGDTTLF
jgi:DNA-binding NarL/FixJ family response regulator